MARVRRVRAVEDDVEHALRHTLKTFGRWKYEEYVALIEEAFAALSEAPTSGRPRPEIDRDAWIYPIGQRGRRARHVLLYRIVDVDEVEVLALAYDAMDLPRRWRTRAPP